MTKPGPHPWATNDTFVAGPDIGSNTKTVPLTAHMGDGYYRSRRPAPDVLNWQLNRNYLTELAVARLQAMNYTLVDTNTTDYQGGLLKCGCHSFDSTSRDIYGTLVYYDATTPEIREYNGAFGVDWAQPGSATIFGSVGTAPVVVAIDGSDTAHRVALAHWSGATDKVAYSTSYTGMWTAITFSGGAPGYEWGSVASDRNTAGGASADWCIGTFSTGGNTELWSSADGITFAKETGFPVASSTLDGIYHSHHPVGALGPGDTGNPVWLATISNSVYRSTDHVTWADVGSITYAPINNVSLAYSRPSRRWVCAHSNANFGKVSYSDDNGATWTLNSSALPIDASMAASGNTAHIVGDGYGTFIITRERQSAVAGSHMWVSVDEGLTWSIFKPCDDITGDDGHTVIGASYDSDVDATATGGSFFVYAGYNDATPDTKIYRSLVV